MVLGRWYSRVKKVGMWAMGIGLWTYQMLDAKDIGVMFIPSVGYVALLAYWLPIS